MLEGAGICLRCLEREDLPLVAQWRNQREVRQFFFNRALLSMAGQSRWFEQYVADGTRQIFIAVGRDSGKPLGMIGLYRIDRTDRKAEIGSTMVGDRNHWGKGIAAEMIRLVLDYSFEDLGLNRVYAYALEHNIGSAKAKLKCGFRQEGLLREDHFAAGQYHNVVILGITRADWEIARHQSGGKQ